MKIQSNKLRVLRVFVVIKSQWVMNLCNPVPKTGTKLFNWIAAELGKIQ